MEEEEEEKKKMMMDKKEEERGEIERKKNRTACTVPLNINHLMTNKNKQQRQKSKQPIRSQSKEAE